MYISPSIPSISNYLPTAQLVELDLWILLLKPCLWVQLAATKAFI